MRARRGRRIFLGGSVIESSSSEASSEVTPGSESSEISSEETVFTEDDYNLPLLGKFYSPQGEMTVEPNLLRFGDLELKPTSIRNRIIYEGEDGTYSLSLTSGTKRLAILEKENDGEYEEIATFMPSIAGMAGTYSAYGNGDPYNYPFIIADNYSPELGYFEMGYCGFSDYGDFYTTSTYRIVSYFMNTASDLPLCIDIVDSDDYLFYSWTLFRDGDTVGLAEVGADEPDYLHDATLLYGTYFAGGDTVPDFNMTADYDEDTWEYSIPSTCIMNEVTFNLSFEFVEGEGVYYVLKNDTREIKFQGYAYGIRLIENGVETICPFNSLSHLDGSYDNADISFTFDGYFGDVLTIDGASVEYTKVVHDGKLGIAFTHGGSDYIVTQFQDYTAVVVTKDGVDSYAVNTSAFISYYAGTFHHLKYNSHTEFTVGSDLKFTLGNAESQARLVYDPLALYPSLVTTIDGLDITVTVLDPDQGIYEVRSGEDSVETYIGDEAWNALHGEFTSGKGTISFNGVCITYDGVQLTTTIKSRYVADTFSYRMYIETTTPDYRVHNIDFVNNSMLIDMVDGVTIETYITKDRWDTIVGCYYFEGRWGPECIEVTAEGKVIVDVLNDTGDGTVAKEFDYHVGVMNVSGDMQTYIQFNYGADMWLYFYQRDCGVYFMDTIYAEESLFYANGIYGTSDMSSAIFIDHNKVYVDGTEITVSSISTSDGDATITLADESVLEITYGEDDYATGLKLDDVVYEKAEITLDSFKGTYEDTTNGLSVEIKDYVGPLQGGVSDGIEIVVTTTSTGFSTSYTPYSSTTFTVVAEGGYFALKLSTGTATYTFVHDGTTVTFTYAASIPLPPVPPPPPPAI